MLFMPVGTLTMMAKGTVFHLSFMTPRFLIAPYFSANQVVFDTDVANEESVAWAVHRHIIKHGKNWTR